MFKTSFSMVAASLILAGLASQANAGDVAAGKAIMDKTCSACHEAADWHGTSEAELVKLVDGVAKGTTMHKKKLTLTDADVANIAAYWAAAAK